MKPLSPASASVHSPVGIFSKCLSILARACPVAQNLRTFTSRHLALVYPYLKNYLGLVLSASYARHAFRGRCFSRKSSARLNSAMFLLKNCSNVRSWSYFLHRFRTFSIVMRNHDHRVDWSRHKAAETWFFYRITSVDDRQAKQSNGNLLWK